MSGPALTFRRSGMVVSAAEILTDPRLAGDRRLVMLEHALAHALDVAVAHGWPVSPSLLVGRARAAA